MRAEEELRRWGCVIPQESPEWLARCLWQMRDKVDAARVRYALQSMGEDPQAGVPWLVEVQSETPARLEEIHSRDPQTGRPWASPSERQREVVAMERELRDAVTAWWGEDGWSDVGPMQRTPRVGVRVVVELAQAGVLTREEALMRVPPASLSAALLPVVSGDASRRVVGRGVAASPGAASGRVCVDVGQARELVEQGEAVVLVRPGTTPADLPGFSGVVAVVTATGGQTCHAAIISRDRGLPCVVGVADLQIDEGRGLLYLGDHVCKVGESLTVDGTNGELLWGVVDTVPPPEADADLQTLLAWADEAARVQVWVNADTEVDARRGRALGAAGIGLCRSEHLFFQEQALWMLRRLLLAEDERSRREAVVDLIPGYREGVAALLRAMGDRPVTIRLLDPPMSTFLEDMGPSLAELASSLGVSVERARRRVASYRETNPILGMRGARIGVAMPALYEMQVRSILEASADVVEAGGEVELILLVPMVVSGRELGWLRDRFTAVAEEVLEQRGVEVPYQIGAMVEVPRACLRAEDISQGADFLVFGTNDLTQCVWGMARDDHGRYAQAYQEAGVWERSPMERLDEEGVGALIEHGIEGARRARPSVRLGLCGEQASDPDILPYLHRLGIHHVSVSPYRVPVMRLAAAQAALAAR